MGFFWSLLWISATLFPFCFFHSTQSQLFQIVKNTTISWTIEEQIYDSSAFTIFHRNTSTSGFSFACRFQCFIYPTCDDTFLFGVFAMSEEGSDPRLVWTPHRNQPVRINATLLLTGDGDLILNDDDGTLVWSTNTKGKSVAGLNLTESGNLVLFDTNNKTVWQSFDHPTDTLLLDQKLRPGQKLTASTSSGNPSEGGSYSLAVTNEYLFAFMGSDPSSQIYFQKYFVENRNTEEHYAILLNGSINVFTNSRIKQLEIFTSSRGSPLQHVRLDFDGHLRFYDRKGSSWQTVDDILTWYIGNCGYPLVCEKYGICSFGSGESGSVNCSCPRPINTKFSYFKQTHDWDPNLGCSEINPLSCENKKFQTLVELKNVIQLKNPPDSRNTSLESCKLACLHNCSCRALMFDSRRDCYLTSEVYTMKDVEFNDYETLHFFLKVEDNTPPSKALKILGWSLGAFSVFLIIIGLYIVLLRKKKDVDDLEEDYLNQALEIPKRYSYNDLIATTNNFSKKLGQGGFGSVFEGTLSNGTKVAVKCLDGFGHIKESFLSEVKTIGGIHHVNLVRLMGYCNNKSHKLLVYEYMCNGSLDKWISRGRRDFALAWQTRRMIILDIAKGLAYLHDGCSQKIFHLDIKPQNILLDKNLRAKVCDFGLSKLIDRDQSQVVTVMKGTPGYLAPEWINSTITEKVDVYSFGVVVLEILCGRKNLDRSQPEEDMHLLSVFKRKAEQDRVVDMIDKNSESMLSNAAEVIKIMKIAARCLQSDSTQRPSMSVVVKILEGLLDVEENLEHDFSFSLISRETQTAGRENGGSNVATVLLPSKLSGPR